MNPNARGETEFNRFEKASITLNHLRSNSATHESPFSAVAELCDNAHDADANNLHIDFIEKGEDAILQFLDDGVGMSHEEAVNVISFGHSVSNGNKIGKYGNGLKSGGFHLGTELLMLTKKDGIQTALFISHRFHKEKGLTNAVFVPCPAFKLDMEPVFYDEVSKDRFDQEMDIIEEYAPLGGRKLQEHFKEITGSSGTLILISGLKRSVVGRLSIILSDPEDIQLEGDNLKPYQQSLRKYLEILYLKPKTRIHLRGKQIVPKRLIEHWIARRKFVVRNEHFNGAHNVNLNEIAGEIHTLNLRKNDLESEIGTMNNSGMGIDIESREKRKKVLEKLEYVNKKIVEAEKKKKEKELSRKYENSMFYMHCGIETKDRSNNGIHFYTNNRLIIWGLKAKSTFFKSSQPKEHTIGISVYMNLNYDVFHPTHNKQGFSHARDFNMLVKKCDENLEKYSEYVEKNWIPWHLQQDCKKDVFKGENTWKALWNFYGYPNAFSLACQQTPFDDNMQKIVDKACGVWKLCQICRNWRRLNSLKDIEEEDPAPTFFQCNNIINEDKCPIVSFKEDERFKRFVTSWAPFALKCPSTRSTNGRLVIKAEDRIVQQPAPSANFPRIATPARPDPSPNTRQRVRIAPNNPRVAMMHSDDDESGNEHQGATSSAQRPRRELAREPAKKISRRRELSDQEDDVEEKPISKKKLNVKAKKPTNLHGGMRPSGSSRPPIMSKEDELANLLRERVQWKSHIQRLEDGKEEYDHKIDCVFDELKKKHNLKIPVTGTPFDKLSAVYEDIVPRSTKNAKK